jgi:hypothetical protein
MTANASTAGRADAQRTTRERWWPVLALAFGCALVLAAPVLGVAQVSADSARRAAVADSLRRAAGDSSVAGQPGTASPSSTPAASGAPAPDRVPPASGPGSSDPVAPRLPINVGVGAPSDTTLLRACTGVPGGREAPGLLAVVFRTGTIDRDRIAAAKAVGGSLAGRSAYGEEYVRLAVGSGPLAAVADRLIRQDPVVRVSPAPCPAQAITPPAPPATPADSARAPVTSPQGQAPARTSP